MEENYSLQQLLALRKLTRAITEVLRGQMKEYLTTIAPLLRPKTALGEYIKSSARETASGASAAFKELQNLYEAIAKNKPFLLNKELDASLDIMNTSIESTPMEYVYEAKTESHSKTITITSPLQSILTYAGYAPAKLKELLADRYRTPEKVQEFIVHYLALHITITRQPGLAQMLNSLHFPLVTKRLPEFGELPITCLTSAITTIRPPDSVLIEATELSGLDAFEEVVSLEDIAGLRDPLKERLLEIARSHGENL
ncbi:MAG TPA: hypothetical protein VFZ34_30430 [Blastocatellia bacterium]|nr:hypothetical protein [Blastocatellia bacterium]